MSANLPDDLRARIGELLLARVADNDEARRQGLKEFLAMTCPDLQDGAATGLADLVPPLLPELYGKWIGMFADRLLETVPQPQVEELCSGSAENTASLLLVFLMYLESATMEQQIAEDLKAYGIDHSSDEDGGMVVADYIRARMQSFKGKEKLH